MHTKMKTSMMHDLIVFIFLLVIYFQTKCSHVMINGKNSHIKERKFSFYLFYKMGITPCKITLTPFTFINNSIVILRGLIWLFIFKLVPFFGCHAEAFLHIAS
jgi:hypothetical protein